MPVSYPRGRGGGDGDVGVLRTSKDSEMPVDMNTTSASKYELEDYVYEMECRAEELAQGNQETEEDVHARLAQKERDLILAAELGKALLERNEILVQQNERLAEDYSHKLEVLEQEKHGLRRKLAAAESEFDVKVQEINIDLQHAKSELQDQRDALRQTDREKSQLIDQLTEQNQRLTSQLKESSKHEHQLEQQLQMLRDQFNLRKSNMSEQVSTLEVLSEEINLLTEKKMDLERRIDSLLNEREGLSTHLDESSDRIMMLEKQSREQEAMLRNSQRDLDDLRHTNLSLTDRLEALSRNSSSPSMGHTSLMNEIDMSDHEASRPHSHPSLPEDLLELDEIECDDPVLYPTSDAETLKTGRTSLRQEVVDAVGQLRVLTEQLRHRRRNSLTSLSTNSSDELTPDKIKGGVLLASVREVHGLVRDLLRREAQGQCSSCGRGEDRVTLEQEVHRALEAVDKLNIELSDVKDKLKAKTDEAAELGHQVTLGEAQLKAVEEHRDTLKHDLDNTHLAKDELIKKAWDMRDNAVARKNACEIELARTRIDVMQVNSQLMEAIQQKVELSQQLEQWQVDMQQLLDEQMRRKLSKLEMGSGSRSAHHHQHNQSDSDSSSSGKASPRKNSRLFSILTTLKR
ncbi:bicaudal D-related protein homolog isoform X1 [Eriocheir sinensis]|uniref:bicaudal D-related protein homolog isoform X1 n=1 Tax=Eriocheir sinensis TaxID=95602 RepID=UPI0021C9DFF5|nr:bicaudal D-related protein homolog isoform X1 [Eriocheir sinensis]XP_050728982.1 bicaudal D-related protein homolog isoform X1 [Eriocheir sinensis]